MIQYFDADEFVGLAVDAAAGIAVEIAEKHGQTQDHGPSTADLVDLPGLAKSGFDNVAVVVVILDVMAKDLGRRLDGQHVVDDQLAETGQIAASLVQFLDLGVLVLFLVLFFDKNVRLYEIVQRLLQSTVRLVDQRPQQRIVFQLLAKRDQQIANRDVCLLCSRKKKNISNELETKSMDK